MTTTSNTAQIVQVVSGRVFGEVSRVRLGRCPEAKDGTYLLETLTLSGEILESRLTPIATDFNSKRIGVPLMLISDGEQETVSVRR